MNWNKEYNNKKITVDDALNMVKSNYDIVVGLASAEPMDFLNRLHETKDKVKNVNVLTCLNMGDYKFTKNDDMYGHFTNLAWFYTPLTRKAQANKTASFIPNHLHLSAKHRLGYKKPNIFMTTVSPMDRHGYFSLSLSLTYELEFLKAADIVIFEVNENYPKTYGDTFVHIRDVDYLYESNRPVPELPIVEPSDKDMIIGGYISELVDDGSTIQLGIGGIPNAVAKSLENKKDLGIHTEMFTDGMVDLYKAGAITNKRKSIHKEKAITTFALGSKKLYDFIDDNPGIELRRGAYTNDPYVIGQNYKMVSINTSLQVDLTGQVCSESLGHVQYSGTGGQADTAIGAQMSSGGKSIIALYSTAKRDTISTIVPLLTEGAAVSLSRNDVDCVVTEYGVAYLKGREIRQRVDNLIAIAHPDFREEIKKKADELMLW